MITKKIMLIDNMLKYWFSHENVWFNSTPEHDQEIRRLFSKLLYQPLATLSPKIALEKIILYDQVVRHIYRDSQDRYKINSFGLIALSVSRKVLELGWDSDYSPAERCFLLLPFRHTFQPTLIKYALKKIREYRQVKDSKYYVRFYKAALLSLSRIETPLIAASFPNNTIRLKQIFEILDPDCCKDCKETVFESISHEKIYKAAETCYQKLNLKSDLTISLSGGVDSMVASLVFLDLSKKYNFNLIAVTVNYNNRPTAKIETEFVTRWCQKLGISHYVQSITEIHRDRTHDRDLYEKVTKAMRFDLYKRFGYPVILGHNQDDCLENIFSNIKKCKRYNNLKGMTEFTEDSGCLIVRPLLEISKQEIRDFAQKYGIPHLPNSTPSWCERGRLREQFITFMESFSPDFVPGFLKLANNVSEIYSIYENTTVGQFCSQIVYGETVNIPLSHDYPKDYVFWKDVLLTVFNQINLTMVSNKSVKYLTGRMRNQSYGEIPLSKTVTVIYRKNDLKIVYLN